MIAIRDLSMVLSAGGRSIPILDRLSLDIPDHQMVAIVGPSGSGKSTLLGLMAGLDRPTGGTITLDGVELTAMTESGLARFRRDHIGYIFQSFHLIPTLTARDNVAIPLELCGMAGAAARAAELLEAVGLAGRLDHYPVQLSGGEQQRVAIARAFACRPPFLFADEPTGNLDTHTGDALFGLLRQLNRSRNTTFVIVTHNDKLSAQADRIIHMQDGMIV